MPGAVPPPSKLAVDPNIPDGDSPAVEHVVPLVVMAPLVGIPIVPVTLPVGAGLTPAELISVEPIGMPAGPTDPPALMPRGDVVPSDGTAVRGSSTSTWASAGLAHNKDQAVSAINNDLIHTSIRAVGLACDVWRLASRAHSRCQFHFDSHRWLLRPALDFFDQSQPTQCSPVRTCSIKYAFTVSLDSIAPVAVRPGRRNSRRSLSQS
jgi:hypothetical protein